jgi:endo-1,4-beta-xylanase
MKLPNRTIVSVAVVAGAVVAALLPAVAPAVAHNEHHGGQVVIDRPLRDHAKRIGLLVGTAVDVDAYANDQTYADLVDTQFNVVTAENVMKWGLLEPVQGETDFTVADQLVANARANRQKVHGHTLLWHNQLPGWLTTGVANGDIDAAELRTILRRHVFEVMRHFRGKVFQWDVVNEVIDDNGQLRNTIFLQLLGPGYIADMFRWARQADPKARLVMNDYNVEFPGAKADAYYALVRDLLKQKVPIDALGAQGHLGLRYGLPTTLDMFTNLKRFQDLGLDIVFTEADIRILMPVDIFNIQAQAQGYSALLQTCLLLKRCVMFTVWGFTDKYSWVPGVFPEEGAATLYDENFAPKPAYREVQAVLAAQVD